MQVRILGCSGGIAAGLRTTAILIDDDILIDAGTGVGDLTLDELRCVKRLFLTHSHLDHTVGLPLFVDAVFETFRHRPLEIYAHPETIAALQSHLFNDVMWPDFSRIPSAEAAAIKFRPIESGCSRGRRQACGSDAWLLCRGRRKSSCIQRRHNHQPDSVAGSERIPGRACAGHRGIFSEPPT